MKAHLAGEYLVARQQLNAVLERELWGAVLLQALSDLANPDPNLHGKAFWFIQSADLLPVLDMAVTASAILNPMNPAVTEEVRS